MKFSRMLAVGAATALVGVSTLAIGGAAVADDFYVDAADLTASETSPYSAGWFQGNVSTPGGSFSSTTAGLDVTGAIQILNGDALALAPGTPVTSMAPGLTVVSGNPSFQISVFTTGDAGFTTLYADAAGIAADEWFTSQAWGGFTAKTVTESLATYEAAMEPDSQMLAFGFMVIDGESAEIASLSWNGDRYFFLPDPTATITPASLTVAAMGTTGVSGVFTGFIPGEAVVGTFGNGGSGGTIPGSFTADADGSVTVAYTEASLVVGTYFLGARGVTSGVLSSGSFAVTANPAELAATGTDFTPAIVTGGILLLLGTGLVLAGRRRAAAHRS